MENNGCLSFFTANHYQHDKQWLLRGDKLPLACFACFVEIIENKDEPSIRKNTALAEILRAVSEGHVLPLLVQNEHVLSHLTNCLWELTDADASAQHAAAVETLHLLCSSLKSEKLLDSVLGTACEKISACANVVKCLPHLNLLGKLVQKIAGSAEKVVRRGHNVVAFVAQNATFPDEKVRSSLFFLLALLYRDNRPPGILDNFTESILRDGCDALTSAASKELQINSIALLESITQPGNAARYSATIAANVDRLVTALKKAFLSRNELVQTMAVSCLQSLLLFDQRLIASDVVGFLFEVFTSASESLVTQGYRCLSKLAEEREFYTKGHAAYGFEAVLAATKRRARGKNAKLARQGFAAVTKLFASCPESLALVTETGILPTCLEILDEGMSSLDEGSLLQCCRCLEVFLDRRHFACELPLARLLGLIDASAKRLERICKDVSSRTDNIDTKISITGVILEILKKSLHLAKTVKEEAPSIEILLTAREDTTRQETDTFANGLLQLCDQRCIPAVIGSFRKLIGNASALGNFFQLLCQLLAMCPEKSREMCRKFAASSFIRISLDAKAANFGKDAATGLRTAVDSFLGALCVRLSPREMAQEVEGLLPCLAALRCAPSALLEILKQCHSGDHSLRATHECIIMLFHISHEHGDKLVPAPQLASALATFIVLNRDCFGDSLVLPRCLTQLYVGECRVGAENAALHAEARRVLSEEIERCRDRIESVYFHDFAFVEWAVEATGLSPKARQDIIQLWFTHETEYDESRVGGWRSLVQRCPHLMITFAAILGCGETRAQTSVLRLTQELLRTSHVHTTGLQETFSVLKMAIQQLFLHETVEPLADENLKSVLRLLCMLTLTSEADDTTSKLVYHAVNLLVRSRNWIPHSVECLNFLNACLVQESKADSRKVIAFLLNHREYNAYLETLLRTFTTRTILPGDIVPLVAAIMSVNHLAHFQMVNAIHSECTIELNIDSALAMLSYAAHPSLQFAANALWATVLKSEKLSTNLCLGGEGGGGKLLSGVHRRMILLRLQNSLLQNNILVQMSALRCMEALLSAFDDTRRLLKVPWNRALLREVSANCGSSPRLTICFGTHALFVSQYRRNGLAIDFPTMELLQRAVQHLDTHDSSSGDQHALVACAQYIREMTQGSPHALSSMEATNVRTSATSLAEAYGERVVDTNDGFIEVEGIFVFEEFVYGKTRDPRDVLKQLADTC